MSKELETLNYLVNLAVVGNKENNRGKVFTSEEIVSQALKRNEPMKVKKVLVCDDPRIIAHYCPNCGEELFKTDISYCPYCGQKLDWKK